ncbi:hypothetical protein [Flavilitoribacter nigricans]|uniref:Uncharacterized protein n=1 Tax=Flavilitoribacter nigricans (strain ATCC 23147 / DSM 23189 / NBRC 102662 / NCIMB 1420 / SS-2) TaxID=1122177 RepID=A0A2D0NH53_FLAN2|nr:hypothetical protein [Flavilitoribacter nigricans]PHN07093.1 hypothetical protein CRP01_07630 [Flavilitoribacter nigricans DSM 23189 = NBRC 102662]
MVTSIRKYKILILTGLLTAYLAGSVQGLLLEGLHAVVHLAKEFSTEFQHSYYQHAHEDGEVHTHRHVVLETIEDSLGDPAQDAPPAQEDQQQHLKKKNPEHRSIIDPIAFFISSGPANPVNPVYPVSKVFSTIPTPPPKFSALA